MSEKRIKFQGIEYLLIGEDDYIGRAIATEEEYSHCLPSYAHLNPDGTIERYRQHIGTIEDIEFLD